MPIGSLLCICCAAEPIATIRKSGAACWLRSGFGLS